MGLSLGIVMQQSFFSLDLAGEAVPKSIIQEEGKSCFLNKECTFWVLQSYGNIKQEKIIFMCRGK